MTLAQIQQVGFDHDLPRDYPLRGTKRQQAQQVMNFFQHGYEFDRIAYSPAESEHTPKLRADRDAVRAALATELSE